MSEEALRRAQKDRVNPCQQCGWGESMGIHMPAITGPRKGQPWGHAFVPRKETKQ